MTPRTWIPIAFLLAQGLSCQAGERYALVVGVNECPNFQLAEGVAPRPLRGAEADAQAMAATLEKQFGFARSNIVLLQGDKATHEAVTTVFLRLQQQARPDDCVVFHFSGHGTQLPDRAPLDETADRLDEALCLADATQSGKNLLVDDELGRLLEGIDAERVTVILDCCHAGTGTKDPDDDVVARYLPFPGVRRGQGGGAAWREISAASKSLSARRTALLACQPDEQAYERRLGDAPARAGQFTHYLLAGLAGPADTNRDGAISNTEAIAYARAQLDTNFNRARQPNTRQQPMLETNDAESPVIVGK